VYPVVGWYLFYRSLHRPNRVSVPFGWQMWVLYAGIWFLSMWINLALGTAEMGRSVTATGSITGVWLLTAAVWYATRRLGIRYPIVVRAICILGVAQLMTSVLGQIYVNATGMLPPTQSLLVTLVPNIPARLFFEARLFNYELLEWDGDPVTRLRSFYYWAPLAGTMSLFVCMGSWCDRDRVWKWLGFAGGVVTILLSAGRAAQVALTIALLIVLWFGSRKTRQALIWTTPVLGLASPWIVQKLYYYFFEYRSDSTEGRLALYDETWKAFTRSPFIGYGAQGRSQVLDVPLGSHSQLWSTLYQTGFIGSAVLIVAWTALLWVLFRFTLRFPSLAPTLGAWVALTMVMITGELAAASVTVFVLAAWLGTAWNWVERQLKQEQLPWLRAIELAEPPTPWDSLHRWWYGFR
jgi:O-Antigen ligase